MNLLVKKLKIFLS